MITLRACDCDVDGRIELNIMTTSRHYELNTYVANMQTNDIYPQVLNMGPNYDWQASNSLTRITSNTALDFTPNLRSFHLDPLTKLTDIISQGYIYTRGLLISRRLVDILKTNVLPPNRLFAADVIHAEVSQRYFWMHMTEESETRIDYRASTFTCELEGCEGPETVMFSNHNDLRSACRSLVNRMGGNIRAQELVFQAGTPDFDLFFVQLTSRHIYISDRLRSQLIEQKVSGVEILPSATVVKFP